MEQIETKSIHCILEESMKCLSEYIVAHSSNPFYLARGKYKTLHDFPFIDKTDLLNDQKDYPPFGLLGDIKNVKRIHATSGSTGTPFFILLSEKDIQDNRITGGRSFRCAGLKESDVVIHCLNYCLWAGGLTDHLALEETGAKVIPFGVGNSNRLIETILLLKPNCISCTPSYISRLEKVLDDMKIEPHELGLKKALCGGEPFFSDNIAKDIESKWGMKLLNANYGMSDVISIFGSECEYHDGIHFHGQGVLYPEIIDDKLNFHPIEKGVHGELVLTALRKESQPIIRFRTHDLVTIIEHNKCRCGRGSFRFQLEGRSDDMLIIKGVNVFPKSIKNIVQSFPWFTGRIIVQKKDNDDNPLKLYIELNDKYIDGISQDIISHIVEKCRLILSVSPEVFIRQYQNDEFCVEGKNKWTE